jgi:hypothetical protein
MILELVTEWCSKHISGYFSVLEKEQLSNTRLISCYLDLLLGRAGYWNSWNNHIGGIQYPKIGGEGAVELILISPHLSLQDFQAELPFRTISFKVSIIGMESTLSLFKLVYY